MNARKDPSLTGKLYGPRPTSTLLEEWRDIPGYEGMYLASSLGRLYSIDRGVFFRPSPNSRGYHRTILGNKEIGYWDVRVHVVIALTFIGPYPKGKEINHRNGIKIDNRAVNLEYIIHRDNVQHAYDNGLRKLIGGENGHHRLTARDVRSVRRGYRLLVKKRGYIKRVADKYNVTPTCIWSIVHDKTWLGVHL